jgi:hypothetical protein
MITLLSAIIIAASIVWAAQRLVSSRRDAALRDDASKTRVLALLQLFAMPVTGVSGDPRALISWHPLARSARALFPDEFASLDSAYGGEFPFTRTQIEEAHARWTADWLAWERTHDTEYKLKATEAERQTTGDASVVRARLDSIEREKLDRYQRRYEEYVRVAKALQALTAK